MAFTSKNLFHFLFSHSIYNVVDLIKLSAGVYQQDASCGSTRYMFYSHTLQTSFVNSNAKQTQYV